MKVLLFRRKSWGELGEYTEALSETLSSEGVEARIEDAEDWLPQETGKPHDKAATKTLRERATGFDLVHAFGSRCAWACAEALGEKKPWGWTAYEMPATDHKELLKRLRMARFGFCASHAVKRKLGDVVAKVRYPGIPKRDLRGQDLCAAKVAIGLDAEAPLVLTRRGGAAIEEAADRVRRRLPQASFMQALGEETGELLPLRGSLDEALAAADLWVEDRPDLGFSLPTVKALMMGVPVILRDSGCLSELVIERTSGAIFREDYALADVIASHLQMPEHLRSMGYAGRVRALEQFDLAQHVQDVLTAYRKAVSG